MKKAGFWPCLLVDREAGYFLVVSDFFGSVLAESVLAAPVFAAPVFAACFTQLVMSFLRSSRFSFFSFACAAHSLLRAFCASLICFLGDSVVDFSAFGLSPFLSCAMAVTLAAAN